MAEARQFHVDNSPTSENPDWQEGYGFQFWMCRHDAYRGDGAFGQFLVIVPDSDAVIVVTAENSTCRCRPTCSGSTSCPRCRRQRRRTPRLTIAWPSDSPARNGDDRRRAGGRARGAVTFARTGELDDRLSDLSSLRVETTEDGTRLVLVRGGVESAVDVRAGGWSEGRGTRRGSLFPPVVATGGWTDDQTYAADLVFVTSPHRLRIRAQAGATPTFEATWAAPPL